MGKEEKDGHLLTSNQVPDVTALTESEALEPASQQNVTESSFKQKADA